MKIEQLPWDTNFFGYPVAKVTLENFQTGFYDNLRNALGAYGIRLSYIYPADQESSQSLNELKIYLADTKLTFEKRGDYSGRTSERVFPYESTDTYPDIECLALLSGEYSRFKIDTNFRNNEFHRLYTEWIRRSINKEIATDILVYKEADKLQGFVSYKIIGSEVLTIGLIAVDPGQHGKGIGKLLLGSVENIVLGSEIKKIQVSTQLENRNAVSFYKACGYTIIEQQEIFHLWMP